MPIVPFDSLPDSARVWVFGADRPITGAAAERLLGEVDRFLAQWKAHGTPLRCAADWREDRFLTIGVDQSTAGASGCSIDGLYRTLRQIEPALGAELVGSGCIFYREPSGAVASVARDVFPDLATMGALTRQTLVFDPTVTTLGDWRARFETELGRSWHAQLLPEPAR